MKDEITGLEYEPKKTKKEKEPQPLYIDRCVSVCPNNDGTQEIYVEFKTFENMWGHLVFTPEDWLDTFTPTMYEDIKKNYIKYIKEKK